jgi:signal peptidase I
MPKVIKMEENLPVFIIALINVVLISGIEFTKNDAGKDEVVLSQPFVIEGSSLSPYLREYTDQNMFYISPSKIITLAMPTKELQDKYSKLVSE